LVVPPNVAVEQHGKAILGGFGDSGGAFHGSSGTIPETASNAGITIKIAGTAVMGVVGVVVNQRAPPALLLTMEEATRLMQEPAPPSTTREDVYQQKLGEALARRDEALARHLGTAQSAAAAALERANERGSGAALLANHGPAAVPPANQQVVVQGVPVPAASK